LPVARNSSLKKLSQATILSLSLWIVSPAISQSPAQAHSKPTPASSPVRQRFARVVDRVVKEGVDAYMPPHISSELGIAPVGERCLVRQSSFRKQPDSIQAFNVSSLNHDDLIIFVAHASLDANGRVVDLDQATSYLTSPSGMLRKVATVVAGQGGVRRITLEDRKVFEEQKKFWLDRLAPIQPPAAK
jgi:hypothetical protein